MRDSHIFGRQTRADLPIVAAGEGVWLIDSDGNRYLDASGGAAVSSLGHSCAPVLEAAKAQLDRVRFLSLEDHTWLATIHRQHEAIVEHVLAGDATGAATAMADHLRAVFASIATIARISPEYFNSAAVTPADRLRTSDPGPAQGGVS